MNPSVNKIIRRFQLVIILIAIVVMFVVYRNGSSRMAESDAQRITADAELAAIISERNRVFAEMEYMNSDAFFEQVLRRHGRIRPGETLFIIVE